jgi:uncharacterized protein (DUF885 family)
MNDEFDALVNETFYTFMEFQPEIATFFGLHQYDKKMPSGTRESYLDFVAFLSEYFHKFQSIHREDLSKDRRIDLDLMIFTLKNNLFHEKEIRQWEKDPNPVELISTAIYPLYTREFAPFSERLESIIARLKQCPQFIEEFKSRIKTPVELWKGIAVESCETLPLFLDTISATAQNKGLDTSELDESAARVADVLSQYVEWLHTLSCDEPFMIGKDMFKKLLAVRELGLTADEILKIGEDYLKKEKDTLKELAHKIDPSSPVEHVRTRIRKNHPPTFQDTLEEYRKAIATTREIVNGTFATIPEGERLIVEETPVFMRHLIPVAAYMPPAKFEDDQMGIYHVTPVEGTSLREHNYASVMNTSVHEGYPGHHLQLVWANKNPSLTRALVEVPEFVEGWAHYCEERMRTYGLQDITVQVVQTLDVILRAARIIIDVNLQCGQMTFDEAVAFLQSETGMEQLTAIGEVKWYTKEPGYPMSYLLGKHFLLQLQKDVQEHLQEDYSEKQFHDTLLQGGSLPFVYLREELKEKGML